MLDMLHSLQNHQPYTCCTTDSTHFHITDAARTGLIQLSGTHTTAILCLHILLTYLQQKQQQYKQQLPQSSAGGSDMYLASTDFLDMVRTFDDSTALRATYVLNKDVMAR